MEARQKNATSGKLVAGGVSVADEGSALLHSTTDLVMRPWLPPAEAPCPPGMDAAGRGSDLRQAWADFIVSKGPWLTFATLTFSQADRTHAVTVGEAVSKWRRLVRTLNTELFGNHYVRIVGHSYFGYTLAIEYGDWGGLLHMHALIDRRTDWKCIKNWWEGPNKSKPRIGICLIKPVRDVEGAARYLSKYVTKGGQVSVYKPKADKEPAFKPMWYLGI